MKKLILCVLSVASIAAFAAPEVWVSPTGSDLEEAGTEGNPYATIAYAVSNCDVDGTVWVKKGTYLLTAEIALDKAITVRPVDGAGETTISGGMTLTYTNKGDPNNYTEGVRVFNITAAATSCPDASSPVSVFARRLALTSSDSHCQRSVLM